MHIPLPVLLKKIVQSHIILSLVFLGIIIWIINLKVHADYFILSSDAAIYADIARNITMGHGPTSNITMPVYTNFVPQTKYGTWPAFYPPLYPLLIAASFKIFGVSNFSAVLVNGFFFVATIPLIYLLAKKLFAREVAILASIWYIFTPALLLYSITPITESLFTFLIVLTVYLILVKKNFFVSGLLVGLSFLTKFQGILLLSPILIYIVITQKTARLKNSLQLLIGFLLIATTQKIVFPPLAQDFSKITNHFFWNSLAYEAIIPHGYLSSSITPITIEIIRQNIPLIIQKILSNSFLLVQNIFINPHTIIFLLFGISFLKTSLKTTQHTKLLTILLLSAFALFHIATIFDMRYLYPFLPLILIPSADFLLSLKLNRFALSAIVIVPILITPGFPTSLERSLKVQKPSIPYLLAQIIENNTDENSIVASENFTYNAWYGKRHSILLPESPEQAEMVNSINTILLYSYPYRPQMENGWQELLDEPRDFGNYEYINEFQIPAEDNYSNLPAKAVLYQKIPLKKYQ